MKNLFLACTIMLGIQFCSPMVLRAGDHARVTEMINPVEEEAACKVDAPEALVTPTSMLVAPVQRGHEATTGLRFMEVDRVSDPLLHTAGRFPSAP